MNNSIGEPSVSAARQKDKALNSTGSSGRRSPNRKPEIAARTMFLSSRTRVGADGEFTLIQIARGFSMDLFP